MTRFHPTGDGLPISPRNAQQGGGGVDRQGSREIVDKIHRAVGIDSIQ